MIDRKTALQCLAYCDQAEVALREGRLEELNEIREWLVKYFQEAQEAHITVAVECIRARCEQVLSDGTTQ